MCLEGLAGSSFPLGAFAVVPPQLQAAAAAVVVALELLM